jgi:hypothetical protein
LTLLFLQPNSAFEKQQPEDQRTNNNKQPKQYKSKQNLLEQINGLIEFGLQNHENTWYVSSRSLKSSFDNGLNDAMAAVDDVSRNDAADSSMYRRARFDNRALTNVKSAAPPCSPLCCDFDEVVVDDEETIVDDDPDEQTMLLLLSIFSGIIKALTADVTFLFKNLCDAMNVN